MKRILSNFEHKLTVSGDNAVEIARQVNQLLPGSRLIENTTVIYLKNIDDHTSIFTAIRAIEGKGLTWQLDCIPWTRAWLFEKVCNTINVHPQTVVAVGLTTVALLIVSISFSVTLVKIFEPIHPVKNLK